jgi:hypothetical protein
VITTEYGTWADWTGGGSVTLDAALGDILSGGEFSDEQMTTIAREWRDAINAALPDTVTLAGNDFYGPYNVADRDWSGYPTDEEGRLDIETIIDSVDIWPIVMRHVPTDA